MKANEFRVGQYYNYGNEVIKMDGGLLSKILINDFTEDIKPISLNRDWLLKLGFYKKGGIWIKIIKGKILGIGLDGSYGLYNGDDDFKQGRSFGNKLIIEHVHQLQNLYFALTNEELIN